MPHLNATPNDDATKLIDEDSLVNGIRGDVTVKSITLGKVYAPIIYHRVETDAGWRKKANSHAEVDGVVVLKYSAGYEIDFSINLISDSFGKILTTNEFVEVLRGNTDAIFVASILHQNSMSDFKSCIGVSITDEDFLAEAEASYLPVWNISEEDAKRASIAPCGVDIDEDMAINFLSNIEYGFSLHEHQRSDSLLTQEITSHIKAQLLEQAATLSAAPFV